MWQKKKVYGGLVGKPGSERPFESYSHRTKDYTIMDLKEIREAWSGLI
jgi:hypothetical protein